jgi:hypothetical protein
MLLAAYFCEGIFDAIKTMLFTRSVTMFNPPYPTFSQIEIFQEQARLSLSVDAENELERIKSFPICETSKTSIYHIQFVIWHNPQLSKLLVQQIERTGHTVSQKADTANRVPSQVLIEQSWEEYNQVHARYIFLLPATCPEGNIKFFNKLSSCINNRDRSSVPGSNLVGRSSE